MNLGNGKYYCKAGHEAEIHEFFHDSIEAWFTILKTLPVFQMVFSLQLAGKYMSREISDDKVRPKKHLGQHFLRDENIARNSVDALSEKCQTSEVLEVGPGMGVLTKYLLEQQKFTTWATDVDNESIEFLKKSLPELGERLLHEDFLKMDFGRYFKNEFSLIGNFPYNISSQIVFRIIDERSHVPLMVGMFQKEVAERLGAKPRTKDYGILSVITQAFFDVEYLFTVSEHVFQPPPKVKSAVVRLMRKNGLLGCNERLFRHVVKMAFNQRRKMLRNALKGMGIGEESYAAFATKRAEELSVEDFVVLTNIFERKC